MRWIVLLALLACGGPDPAPLDQTASSAHYLVRFSSGDHVDLAWQEAYHAWLLSVLPVTGAPVEYRKYRNRAHLEALTGKATNGFAEPLRFHTIWPTDNHEVVHALVMQAWGVPPALFTEGIAVAHSTNPAAGDFVPRWNQQDIHALTRAAGDLPDVHLLADSVRFFDYSTQLTYPMAGSFVRWLIDTRGLAPLEQVFRTAAFAAPAADTEAKFAAAYGVTLSAAWQEWRDWLNASG